MFFFCWKDTKCKISATSNMGGPSHSDNFRRCTAGACRSIWGKGDNYPWLASLLTQISSFRVLLNISCMRSLLSDIGMKRWRVARSDSRHFETACYLDLRICYYLSLLIEDLTLALLQVSVYSLWKKARFTCRQIFHFMSRFSERQRHQYLA